MTWASFPLRLSAQSQTSQEREDGKTHLNLENRVLGLAWWGEGGERALEKCVSLRLRGHPSRLRGGFVRTVGDSGRLKVTGS
jgi:hypothetical protein